MKLSDDTLKRIGTYPRSLLILGLIGKYIQPTVGHCSQQTFRRTYPH